MSEGDAADVRFGGDGVRKGVALVNTAERLRTSTAAWYDGRYDEALEGARELREYLAGEVAALEDDGLARELRLVERLVENMERQAPGP